MEETNQTMAMAGQPLPKSLVLGSPVGGSVETPLSEAERLAAADRQAKINERRTMEEKAFRMTLNQRTAISVLSFLQFGEIREGRAYPRDVSTLANKLRKICVETLSSIEKELAAE